MPDEETVAGIVLPDDLSTLNDKEIAKHLAAIAKKFAPYNDENRVITAEDLVEMNTLVEQKEKLAGEQTARAEQAAEVAAKAREARERMGAGEAEPEPEGGTEEEPAGGTEEEPAPAGDEETHMPPETPEPSEPVGPTGDATVTELPKQGEAPAAETTEAIAASATPPAKPKSKGLARPRSVPVAKTTVTERGSALTIVASSDIPNVPTGKELSRDELSEALHARARGLRDGSDMVLVASVNNNAPKHDVSKVLDDEGIRKVWADAHNVDDMVASGGWCAPSDTVYDFVCDFETLPDALDLPSITSTRGGLRYPESPLLADVYNDVNSGFTWTEADDIAAAEPDGPTKPCFVIPCPDFDEVRLQAQGICVTAGNLTDRAYPELTNRYVDLVMTAHAHRMNALTVAKVVAASTDVTPTADADLGAAESLFGVSEFLVNRFRDAFFAGADFVLEGVLPRWARGIIRRDLARRNGVDFENVTNAEIAAAFAEIGVRMQFISNYQPLAANAVAYPASVQTLLYPAGAHTRLDGGSLDLGVVRDSTLNATNDYTAAWTEEFWGVVSRCASYKTTVPVCASGNTGAQVAITCPSV